MTASTQTCIVPGTQILSKTLIYSEKVMFAKDYIPKCKHQEKKNTKKKKKKAWKVHSILCSSWIFFFFKLQ